MICPALTSSVSTLRSALELKAIFDKLQAAEHSGLPPEALRKLEEQASEQGLRTLWKGAKLEVESVVRETADRVLSDPAISPEKRHLRVVALGYMADVRRPKTDELGDADWQAFLAVQKEEDKNDEFVKVDTPASRAREADNKGGYGAAKGASAPPVPPRPSGNAQPTPNAPPPVPQRPNEEAKDDVQQAAYRACKLCWTYRGVMADHADESKRRSQGGL